MKLTKYFKKEDDGDVQYSVESNDVNKKPNLSDFAESVSNFNVIVASEDAQQKDKDATSTKTVPRETWSGKLDFFFSALGYAG